VINKENSRSTGTGYNQQSGQRAIGYDEPHHHQNARSSGHNPSNCRNNIVFEHGPLNQSDRNSGQAGSNGTTNIHVRGPPGTGMNESNGHVNITFPNRVPLGFTNVLSHEPSPDKVIVYLNPDYVKEHGLHICMSERKKNEEENDKVGQSKSSCSHGSSDSSSSGGDGMNIFTLVVSFAEFIAGISSYRNNGGSSESHTVPAVPIPRHPEGPSLSDMALEHCHKTTRRRDIRDHDGPTLTIPVNTEELKRMVADQARLKAEQSYYIWEETITKETSGITTMKLTKVSSSQL
jgi:hypothetical protein